MNIHIANEQEKRAVYALRFDVFVNEQKVPPEIELDEEDEKALHIIAEDSGVTVGCARLILHEGEGHVGRLAVKRSYRGQGVGTEICRFVIDYCKKHGYRKIWLNSQIQAVDFYEKLGFEKEGDLFIEAGIEHIKMEINV